MTKIVQPRGPLPSRVYWTRRIVTLGVALLLVVGIASLLNRASDGSSEEQPPTAKKASAEVSATPSASPTLTKQEKKLLRQQRKAAKASASAAATEPALAEPEGVCLPEDITVSPYVYRAVAWRHSYILLELKTKESPACTWRTSPDTITLRVTGSKGEVWSSRQCPVSVPTKDLVLRNDQGVKIAVVWSGRRSDSQCTGTTRWAPPGWYRVEAAAFAGEPGQLLFELQRPEPEVLTQAPSPTADPSEKTKKKRNLAPGESLPTDVPSGEPSGVVEPDELSG